MHGRSQFPQYRLVNRGVTLIEIIVAISVIAILASLLIPAVMASREAARRVACSSNMRQLVLGFSHYVSTHECFPAARGAPNGISMRKQYSVFTQILPYLDESALFNHINFSLGIEDTYIFNSNKNNHMGNTTVMNVELKIFLCPSDPGAGAAGPTGGCNYRVNLGTERWPDPKDGPVSGNRYISYQAVTDGTSTTVLFSEKLRGQIDGSRRNPRSDLLKGGLGAPYSIDESWAACRSQLNYDSRYATSTGLSWFVGTLSQTCYNHALVPNNEFPDCVIFTNPVSGLVGARSYHPHGVFGGMLDGSTRFFSETIDRQTWRSLGTRGNNDIVDEKQF